MATLDRVLGIALSNAAAAIALALLAAAVGRFARRPAAAHALWVLVLLKLVTPPVWTVPITVAIAPGEPSPAVMAVSPAIESPRRTPPAEFAANRNDFLRAEEASFDDPAVDLAELAPVDGEPADHMGASPVLPSFAPNRVIARNGTAAAAPAPGIGKRARADWARWQPLIVPAACGVWTAGTIAFLMIVFVRVVRFRRCLRYATPAPPELQQRAAALARKMGIRRCPSVWLVPGAVSPMLWALGPARVLVPAELWDRLDDGERDSLLAHELAHLRRRDHWVRWLEVLATAAYWWHPICWWARRALREAEEQCCDAWVLWAQPDGLPAYAAALLETLDFLSARPGSDPPAGGAERVSRFSPRPLRSAVPVLASGMGQFHQLKRRFVMLRQGDVPRALTRGGLMSVFTLGGLLLPVVPTFAQVLAPQPVPPTSAAPVAPAPRIDSVPVTPEERSAREDDDNRDLKPVQADDPSARKKDELKRARDADQRAADNAKQAELQKQLAESRAEVQKLAAALANAEARMRKLEMAAAGDMRDGEAAWAKKIAPDSAFKTKVPSPDGWAKTPKGAAFDPGARGHEDRLDAIEQQLQGLLQEVKAMRADRKAEDASRKDAAKAKSAPPGGLPAKSKPEAAR